MTPAVLRTYRRFRVISPVKRRTSARGSVVVKEFAMVLPSTIRGGEQLQLADMRRRVKAIFVGSAGNLVEWYDFYTYSAFALYFAAPFFPVIDPLGHPLNAASLLSS